jgi:hypothetical protein
MLLREFLIKVVTTYDDKGMKAAGAGAEKLKDKSKDAEKAVGKLDGSLEKAGDEARNTGRKLEGAARDADQAGNKIDGATKKVGGLRGAFGKAGSAIAKFGPAILASAAAAGLLAVGKALTYVNDEANRLADIADGAKKTGLGVEQYQTLSHIAKMTGTDIGTLGKAALKLDLNLKDIAEGGGEKAALALDELGLSTKQLDGKSATEKLALISDAMLGIDDEGRRAILAFELLGKSGTELGPLLAEGSDAINELAAGVGKVFTAEELGKAEAYADAMDLLKKSLSDIAGGAVVELAPILTEIATAAKETLPFLIEEGKRLYDALEPTIDQIIKMGNAVVNRLEPGLVRLWEASKPVVEILGENMRTSLEYLEAPLDVVIDAINLLIESLIWLFEKGVEFNNWVGPFLDDLEEKWPRVFNAMREVVEAVLHPIDAVRGAVEAVFDWLEQVVGKVGFLANKIREVREAVGLGKGTGGGQGIVAATGAAAALGTTTEAISNGQIGLGAAASQALGGLAESAAARGKALIRPKKKVSNFKGDKGKGGSKAGPDFFDFEAQIKSAAKSQAEKFAQDELERLISRGIGSDEAIGMARAAGQQRAKQLEEQFRKAGKVFEMASGGILEKLGLNGPGSILENRPPPQTLLITMSFNNTNNFEITINGATNVEQARQMQDAADQARDILYVTAEEAKDIYRQMIQLEARRLQTAYGGGAQP